MITINQIENIEGRNEQFLPLFLEMKNRNIGKLIENEYFIIDANFNINPVDKVSKLFFAIQSLAFNNNYKYVMYKLNEDKVPENKNNKM